MWEFISGNGIKPPQKRKTDEDKNSYCYKYYLKFKLLKRNGHAKRVSRYFELICVIDPAIIKFNQVLS
jgi:hypothetical protein